MRIARNLAAFSLPALLVLTACGGGSQSPEEPAEESASAAGFPVTVTDARGEVTLDAAPERVVSLSPSLTEILFEVGAGDQVVAADEYSNHPEDAPTTDLSGFTPNVEAIVEYEPDLVVLSEDGDDITEQLEKVMVPVLLLPSATSLDDTYAQLELLGEATGNAEEGAAAADELRTRIDGIVAGVEEDGGAEELTYYHEVDAAMYSVTSETFIGQVYELFGLTNIADAAEDAAGGYPQLSAEFIVEEDPDLVFLSYPGGAEDFTGRPAFDSVTAVQEDRVVELDADTSSRWGPRVADFAEDVAGAVEAARES
ncbi:ABC transporter substrate-binding protein [Actinorugispora endophytica]|uniref:Iron complex transport system substrate-binding protein n=1 Tax=Actinorugispora endophytica TaxID=1605990 RepID=A0A4R6V4E6_9ACTN|nr:ABC transporter substrate-binding protein [Actinorugispora endophytica]TDQ53679.1 iron complex transport system substrate-binding protein [Actinorugispora endophytica]